MSQAGSDYAAMSDDASTQRKGGAFIGNRSSLVILLNVEEYLQKLSCETARILHPQKRLNGAAGE